MAISHCAFRIFAKRGRCLEGSFLSALHVPFRGLFPIAMYPKGNKAPRGRGKRVKLWQFFFAHVSAVYREKKKN